MVEKVWLALRATAFPLFCTVAGASGVYVLGGGKKRGGEQVMNGFAAGVMLAASFFSLLVPAVQGAASWHAPTLGFALGVVIVIAYDRLVARKANLTYTITAYAESVPNLTGKEEDTHG